MSATCNIYNIKLTHIKCAEKGYPRHIWRQRTEKNRCNENLFDITVHQSPYTGEGMKLKDFSRLFQIRIQDGFSQKNKTKSVDDRELTINSISMIDGAA